MSRYQRTLRISTTLLSLATILALVMSPSVSSARNGAYAPGAQTLRSVTIPAGGTATLTVRGFCLDYGKPFPTGQMALRGPGDVNVRNALYYAIQKGYTDNNASQVQLAIWYLRDNTWRSDSRAIAEEIVAQANTVTIPTGAGTSLVDAVAQNTITVTAQFVPQTADAFYGDGQAQVRNTSASEINLYMPIGVVFTVPGAGGQFQDLLAYELAVEQATPAATSTSTPTVQPTAQPTITAVTTSTVEATATGTVVVATPTAPVETPTVEATATTAPVTTAPTPDPATLPQTGDNDMGVLTLTLVVVAALLATLGLVARLRQRHA